MEYEFLEVQERARTLRERLARIEAEHYEHDLNRAVGLELSQQAQGPHAEQGQRMVESAEEAQAVLEVAYRTLKASFDSLAA